MLDEKGADVEVEVDDNADDVTVIDTPSQEDSQSPSEEPEMLTKDQAEKLANEKHSKLDRRISELEKSGEKATKALDAAVKRAEAAEQRLAQAEKEKMEAERKALGDSPDAIDLFEEKMKLKQAKDALEEENRKIAEAKAEWEDVLEEARLFKTTKLAEEIASEYEVDASLLVTLTDGSKEKMETLAKSLPKKTAEDKVEIPKPPDSSKKSRVLTNPTVEQLNKMSMEEYASYVAERDKNKR
jgi:hypothetical protein